MKKLKLNHVSKRVLDTDILKDISLEFEPGLTVILGESGAGKSTLLNLLGQLDSCSDGEITYQDQLLSALDKSGREQFRAESVGFVFQDGNLLSELSVLDNLKVALEISGTTVNEPQMMDLLNAFDVAECLNKKVNILSGGERQRIAIVRAILKESQIILADEPTGNLDTSHSIAVFSMLKQYAEINDCILIVVTHNQGLADRFADRIIELRDGEIISDENHERKRMEEQGQNLRTVPRHASLALREKWRIFKSIANQHILRMLMIAMVISVAIAGLAVAVDMRRDSLDMLGEMNTNYLETDLALIQKKLTSTDRGYNYEVPFSQADIEEINQSNLFKQVTPYVNVALQASYNNNSVLLTSVRYIEPNDFYSERIKSNAILGSDIENENEIILGLDIAEQLWGENYESYIGSSILLSEQQGFDVATKLVGINCTKNAEGLYHSFIPSALTYEVAKVRQSKQLEIHNQRALEQAQTVYSGGTTGYYDVSTTGVLLYGEFPDSDSGIAINLAVLTELYNQEAGTTLSSDEVKNNLNESIVKKLIQETYTIFGLNKQTMKITGIYESNLPAFVITPQAVQTLYAVLPDTVQAYTINDTVSKQLDSYPIGQQYETVSIYRHLIGSISDKTSTLNVFLVFLSLIIALLAVLMTSSFMSLIIQKRHYDIGILKAMGGKNRDILEIFSYETVVMWLVSSLAAVVWYTLMKVLVSLVTGITLDLSLSLESLGIVAAFGGFLLYVASFIPLRRIKYLDPIQLIRHR